MDSVERDIGSRNVYSYIHTQSGNVYEVNHMDTTKDYDLLVRKMVKGAMFDCEIQTYYLDDFPNDSVPTIIWCNYAGIN